MEEFALLAAANGADVQMRQPRDPGESIETFRETIEISINSPTS